MHPINERAHFAGINEKTLPSSVTKPPVGLVPSSEPEAHGDLRRVKELTRQSDHAVYEIRFDHFSADFTFSTRV